MARRPMLLCAVTIASTAVWVAVSDAGAQPQPQPPVVIALADDQTTCAPAALAAVTRALQDVKDVDAARRGVVIAVAWPAAEGLQDAADGFTVAQYRRLLRVPAAEAWFVRPDVYDCPEAPTSTRRRRPPSAGSPPRAGWPAVNVTTADQLSRSPGTASASRPVAGTAFLVVALPLPLAAVASVVIALDVRAPRRTAPARAAHRRHPHPPRCRSRHCPRPRSPSA